jgi:hypothetical protein
MTTHPKYTENAQEVNRVLGGAGAFAAGVARRAAIRLLGEALYSPLRTLGAADIA